LVGRRCWKRDVTRPLTRHGSPDFRLSCRF
jgi:hypothetical protein